MVISGPAAQKADRSRSSAGNTSPTGPAGEPPEPIIRIRAIAKAYAGVPAVKPLNLDITRGEFLCLLGGSGCGKTTLLRMIAGLVEPSAGFMAIDGEDVTSVPPYDRPVNMMFQSYALFPHMNIFSNIAFGLRREGVGKAAVNERVNDALKLVKMEGFERRKPHQLSGGQRQRVALARALVKRPKVLLLDEPLSALDKKLREHTQLELINIQKQSGITFVMVTHDQEEAMSMATRIAVMNAGEIVQIGSPSEIYERPINRFVAEFIGSINFIEGKVEEISAGTATIRHATSDILFRVESADGFARGAPVSIAIRPERLTIAAPGTTGFANSADGTIDNVVYFGSSSLSNITLDSGEHFQVSAANTGGQARLRLAAGTRVTVGWSAEDGFVLAS